MMKTVAIATLGCKVNQFESEALFASLRQKGYGLIPLEEGADITIINTCTVTHRADFQSRQLIRRALRFNPHTMIVVTGCYSQVAPEAIGKIRGVRYLLGNGEKSRIPDLLPLMEQGESTRVQVSDIQKETHLKDVALYSFHHHTRAFLKIQDGCNGSCSYCIVPKARGRSRSLPPDLVLRHLTALKGRGFKEVVLTGIHLGAYGQDFTPPFPLERLLGRLEPEGVPDRIRLSSIEPGDFSPGLMAALSRSTKICPHLHIPIQSGDDEILKKMNRDYDRSFITDLARQLNDEIPNLCIGADVIVGFPGETEERFEQTRGLIESLPISYLHVFPFSKRKGTPAFELPHPVNGKEMKQRAEVMRNLSQQKRRAFHGRFLHRELRVLVEDRKGKETGRWRGFSRNYIPVVIGDDMGWAGRPGWVNQEWRVRVTEMNDKGLVGEVIGR